MTKPWLGHPSFIYCSRLARVYKSDRCSVMRVARSVDPQQARHRSSSKARKACLDVAVIPGQKNLRRRRASRSNARISSSQCLCVWERDQCKLKSVLTFTGPWILPRRPWSRDSSAGAHLRRLKHSDAPNRAQIANTSLVLVVLGLLPGPWV